MNIQKKYRVMLALIIVLVGLIPVSRLISRHYCEGEVTEFYTQLVTVVGYLDVKTKTSYVASYMYAPILNTCLYDEYYIDNRPLEGLYDSTESATLLDLRKFAKTGGRDQTFLDAGYTIFKKDGRYKELCSPADSDFCRSVGWSKKKYIIIHNLLTWTGLRIRIY